MIGLAKNKKRFRVWSIVLIVAIVLAIIIKWNDIAYWMNQPFPCALSIMGAILGGIITFTSTKGASFKERLPYIFWGMVLSFFLFMAFGVWYSSIASGLLEVME